MFDHSKKFMDSRAMHKYRSIDKSTAKKYGEYVFANEMTNAEYDQRYARLKNTRRMQHRNPYRRIYPGYLVVRKMDTKEEYETWMPDHAFEEVYEKV